MSRRKASVRRDILLLLKLSLTKTDLGSVDARGQERTMNVTLTSMSGLREVHNDVQLPAAQF